MPRKARQPRRPRVANEGRQQQKPQYETQKNDPLTSLRLWRVDILVGGRVITIPKRPAADWLEAILGDNLARLLEGESRDLLEDLVLEGADINDAFREAIAEVGGRPWYVVTRLCALWREDQVRAEVMRVVDVSMAPLGAVLDATYSTLVRNMDDKKRAEFERNLAAEVVAVDGDPREAARRAREHSRERAQAIGMPSAATPPRTPRSRRTPRLDDQSASPTTPP